jgi:hypothetical protein
MPKTKREHESDEDNAPEPAPGSRSASDEEDQLPAPKKQKAAPKAASAPPTAAPKAGPSAAVPEAKTDADGGNYFQLGEKRRLTVRTYKSEDGLCGRRVFGIFFTLWTRFLSLPKIPCSLTFASTMRTRQPAKRNQARRASR